MAENGGFRVSFRGFNKQDVLKFIDEMQTQSEKRLKLVQDRCLAAEQDVVSAKTELETAQVKMEALEKTTVELQEQINQLTTLAQCYKNEILALREQAENVKPDDALTAANDRIAYLEDHVAILTEQNARYAKIVGDVNRVVVEARVVSASYLDAAHRKSTDCLNHLDMFLDELKNQTKQAVDNTDNRRQLGDVYMQTLLTDLQELGNSFDAQA